MTPKRIHQLLEPYLSRPLPDRIEYKIQKYMALLDKWGARMPLTSVHDPEKTVRFHFGESIFALSAAGRDDGRLADVGSGAGFPGLAIKLANPALSVSLIESSKKKCAFLHEVVRSLELDGVQIIPSTFESSQIEAGSLSFVTSRALGRNDLVLAWAREKLIQDGSVILWVGGDDSRTVPTSPGWSWAAPVLIPGTNCRFLLRGTKHLEEEDVPRGTF